MAVADVHHLEPAADVVAIGRETHLHRFDHAHVAEDRGFFHIHVMRGEKQTDVQLFGKNDVFLLRHLEGLAEFRRRPDEGIATPLELDDVRAVRVRHLGLLGVAALHFAVLHGHQPLAVQRAVHVGGVEVEAARHDAGLALRSVPAPTHSTCACTRSRPSSCGTRTRRVSPSVHAARAQGVICDAALWVV
jgi:hypothetical protein